MGDWRFYALRPGSGLWLDTNVQIDVEMTWTLSGPNSGKGVVLAGLQNPIAEDGQKVWGKFNTVLFGEEDGQLSWAGVCTAANPSVNGTDLEFIGPWGWAQKIPYSGVYSVWRTNAFDVVRHLVQQCASYKPGFEFTTSSANSMFFVGDTKPPAKPKEPARRKGETKSAWKSSKRYQEYLKDLSAWAEKYGARKPYGFAWWEAPFIGEEVDQLAKETDFDYRERVVWRDKGNLIPRYHFDFADKLGARRSDIAFVDGMNLAKAIDPKNDTDTFANHVIGLGAGEGRDMVRTVVNGSDKRLYQAQYVSYKTVKAADRLRALAQADHKVLSTQSPKVDTLNVWDVPGFASTSSLMVGDEVQVLSENVSPALNLWVKIMSITRNPNESSITLKVETIG